ncbi:thymidylate kinase [Gordonia phage GMA2]|uniref:Uncharacterized protein n=1 Tax=Gordonia phage GMA2 TaxID=1647283 RepID=A0A0K0N7H0_9CAUD|nr:thymidylate kinase [Gordonia phage GMA2]AKJ72611.1 hypothetical protein GMA2_73 [Gordonia phage GMA2]
MLICLEGTDYSGKSTFADTMLQEWLNAHPSHTGKIVPVGAPPKPEPGYDPRAWRAKLVTGLIDQLNEHHDPQNPLDLVIFDRFHVGMPIYGPLFRKEFDKDGFGDIGRSGFQAVDAAVHRHCGITVHVATPLFELLKRAPNREDEYLDANSDGMTREEQLSLLWKRYFEFFSTVGLQMDSFIGHAIDPRDFASDREVRTIHDEANTLCKSVETQTTWPGYSPASKRYFKMWASGRKTMHGQKHVACYIIGLAQIRSARAYRFK